MQVSNGALRLLLFDALERKTMGAIESGAYLACVLGLSWCVVLPEQRYRGIGRGLMAWGMHRADELGLESYIEATPMGRELYERCGFQVVARVDVEVDAERGMEEWESMKRGLLPAGYDAMWRPVGGVWVDGEPQRTWSERVKSPD